MFLNPGNLNEGACRNKYVEGKSRELYEGKNPKSATNNWHTERSNSHVNSHWQELRK